MLTCPFCNSPRLETVGGENGNPFDRKGEKTICLDCGRTISRDIPERRIKKPFLTNAKAEKKQKH